MNSTPIAELVNQLNSAALTSHEEVSSTTRPIIERLCQTFSANPPEEREKAAGLSSVARKSLLTYAWVVAGEAVARNSSRLVLEGLTALVIDNGGFDIRDSIIRLAVLHHSAKLLNVDAAKMFTDVASLADDSELANRVRGFPDRPGNGDLHRFHVRTNGSGPQFRYEFYDPPQSKWWQFWQS